MSFNAVLKVPPIKNLKATPCRKKDLLIDTTIDYLLILVRHSLLISGSSGQ